MSGQFFRERLPDPCGFFEARGLALAGRGVWRTTRCEFHGGSDSMRVNVRTGAFRCMNCAVSGGDVVAFLIAADGLDFVQAAKALGAWQDGGRSATRQETRPRRFSQRDALEVVSFELMHSLVVVHDVRQGRLPTDAQWLRWLEGVAMLDAIAREFRA